MDCPNCNSEVFIDRVDDTGRYWYVCLNPRCSEYRKAFNPASGAVSEPKIQEMKVETVDTTPEVIPDITD